MKEERYFIRWRGDVSGPYDLPVLKDMLEAGKVTKHHQISADQQSWMPVMNVMSAAKTRYGAGKEGATFLKAAPPSIEIARIMPANHSAEMNNVPRGEDVPPTSEFQKQGVRLERTESRPVSPPSAAGSASWYYFNEEQVCGPVAFTVLKYMADKGFLPSDSQVLREGEQVWHPMFQVFGMEDGVSVSLTQGDSVLTGPGGDPMSPAGFWRRTLALVIDSAVLGCVCSVWLLLLYALLWLCKLEQSEIIVLVKAFGIAGSMLIMWIYFTCMESSSSLTTLGKMAVDITVVDEVGQPILYGRANARFWSKVFSSFLLIGFVMAAFTQRKQALHDLIAKTLVIRVNNDR